MEMTPEHYSDLLDFAGLPDDGRHRPEMLLLARKLAMPLADSVAAFLWLHDEDKCRLHLDCHCPEEEPLSGISLRIPADRRDDHGFVTGAITNEPRIVAWLKSRRLQMIPTLFPIVGGLGFLNFFAPTTIAETPLIRGLCLAIAARIHRHRVKRKLDINDALVKVSWQSATTPNQWLQAAAEITKAHTKAKLVLVFRLNRDLRLEAVAGAPANMTLSQFIATPDSLVRKIYQESSRSRILDHYDVNERTEEFNTSRYDDGLVCSVEHFLNEKLRSWIGAAICYGRDPIAVMFVANKDQNEYLPAVFSRTDYALVESICQLVSRAMPQVQTNAAIRQISRATFGPSNQTGSMPTESRLETVLQAVGEHIPGLAGVAIGVRLRATEPSIEQESTLFAEGEARELLESRLSNPLGKISVVPASAPIDGYWFLDLELLNVDQRHAMLHLVLRRSQVAEYEIEILNYLCLDLGQFVRDQQALRNRARELIEFRHAIRSGLQGLGHLDVACDVYEGITKRGQSATELRMSMLRKSLNWARLFATRTRHLVEQTRYLIDEIRREHLRFADYDIGRIVRETIKCLQPDAEKRRIDVLFHNLMSASGRAVVDGFLIEITLFNLLDNAIKYSFRGREIRVVLEQRGRFWVLSIEDFGLYIHPEDFKAIFRPRVRRPTGQASATRPGTGIGLAVVKQVVDAHLGRIDVTSIPENPRKPEEGARTKFTVTIPAK